MNDKQIGEKALKKVLQGLKEKFKDDITSVMMYGSFARGDEYFNDIDLLVITSKSFGSRYKTTKMFAEEVFGEVYWEYGIPISFIVYNTRCSSFWFLSPIGASDNSPAIYRWDRGASNDRVP